MSSSLEPALPHVPASLAPSVDDIDSAARQWLQSFALSLTDPTPVSFQSIFTSSPASWWKDHLALTWSIRCLHTIPVISQLLATTASIRKPSQFDLSEADFVRISPTLAFIRVQFTFETDIAKCFGIANLVPSDARDGTSAWKAWTVFTEMGDLKGHEGDVNRLDVPDKEDVLSAEEVDVLIIGAGQAGLQLASALRTLSVKALIIERGARVGDHWKRVYEFFKLHISKWNCQLAYRPWPSTTPYYPSLPDIANFFNWYSLDTHLNVVTCTVVRSARYDETASKWSIHLETLGEQPSERIVKAGQLVFSTGVTGWTPNMPHITDQELYKGTLVHSGSYRNSREWEGKNAVVVGTGCSAHDIAHDLYKHGANSVTLVQRSATMIFYEEQLRQALDPMYHEGGPPLPLADRLSEMMPKSIDRLLMAEHPLTPRMLAVQEGLAKAGFRTKPQDLVYSLFNRMGGHYLDIGASQLVVDGKIKIKSGVAISSFIPEGLAFEDGTAIPADLVVFATGFSLLGMKDVAGSILDQEDATNLKDIWGLDAEDNVRGVYRYSGHPRLWFAGGVLPFTRYFSKMLAMQILATQEGLLKDRFELGFPPTAS